LSVSRLKRLAELGVGAGALALSVALFASSAAYASGNTGTATPTSGGSTLSGSQSSTQTFSLTSSGGPSTGLDGTNASCQADSATGSTTFYSYLIPAGASPTSEIVSGGVISPGTGIYSNAGTVDGGSHNVGTGSGDIPSVTYSWVKTNLHHNLLGGANSAVYEAGQFCWNQSTQLVTDSWNMEVTFTADANDPTGFTWSAVPGVAQVPESHLAVALPVGGGAMIAGAVVFETRRRRRKVVVSA
jgi:hypothetical protein